MRRKKIDIIDQFLRLRVQWAGESVCELSLNSGDLLSSPALLSVCHNINLPTLSYPRPSLALLRPTLSFLQSPLVISPLSSVQSAGQTLYFLCYLATAIRLTEQSRSQPARWGESLMNVYFSGQSSAQSVSQSVSQLPPPPPTRLTLSSE